MKAIRNFRPSKVEGGHLVARHDGLLCTICGQLDPIHVGASGTPLPSLMIAYKAAIRRHPGHPHKKVM